MYGTGEHCFSADDCYDLEAFEKVIDNSRDPDGAFEGMGRMEKYWQANERYVLKNG